MRKLPVRNGVQRVSNPKLRTTVRRGQIFEFKSENKS